MGPAWLFRTNAHHISSDLITKPCLEMKKNIKGKPNRIKSKERRKKIELRDEVSYLKGSLLVCLHEPISIKWLLNVIVFFSKWFSHNFLYFRKRHCKWMYIFAEDFFLRMFVFSRDFIFSTNKVAIWMNLWNLED